MPTTIWLWETESSEALSSLAPAPTSESRIESYVRDDGPGGLALSGTEQAAHHWRTATRLETLFTGGRCGADGGSLLFKVGIRTPAAFRDELLDWYRQEHLPILLECPVWDGCRFVEEEVGAGCQFHALHQLSHRDALESNERARSRSGPWFSALKKHDWFDEPFIRVLYRRLGASADEATEGAAERWR